MSPPFDRDRIVDPRLGNTPANVLKNRNTRPVTVSSPAREWTAIQLAAIANPFGRALYDWEYRIVHDIFLSSLDASRIRIVETRIMNFPTTLGNQIRVPGGWSFEGDSRSILVH